MNILNHTCSIYKNIIALAIFSGMLEVAETAFETISVCGIALIYTAIAIYSTLVIRAQLACSHKTSSQFIYLAKLYSAPSKSEEINKFEAEINETWSNFKSKNIIYYIDIAFLFMIWALAAVSIIGIAYT